MTTPLIHLRAATTAVLGDFEPKPTANTDGMLEASLEVWSADSLDVGVWAATPGSFSAFRDGYHEVCQISNHYFRLRFDDSCRCR